MRILFKLCLIGCAVIQFRLVFGRVVFPRVPDVVSPPVPDDCE